MRSGSAPVEVAGTRVRNKCSASDKRGQVNLLADTPRSPSKSRLRLDGIWALRHTLFMRNLSESDVATAGNEATSPGADRGPSRLASQVLALRRQRGLTQAQLAQRSGIGQSEISRLERGRMVPTIQTVDRVASALGARLLVVPDGSSVESHVSMDGTLND